MPIYEYECTACGETADFIVRMAERQQPGRPCPQCQGELRWAGLSAPAVGTEQRFGAILQDGTRVKGGLGHFKRRPRTI